MTKVVHAPDPGPLRAAAYDHYGDQMDAMWKAIDAITQGRPVPQESIEAMNRWKAVKARYPKRSAK